MLVGSGEDSFGRLLPEADPRATEICLLRFGSTEVTFS